ncbi:MAG: hypothetical protein AAGK79_17285 [Pseudomonadota bacterium]
MKTSGFKELAAKMDGLVDAARDEFEAANRENAELLVDVAKLLIPVKSGTSRAQIQNVPTGDGGQIVDFGPKSKVIEGDRGPRPFVNTSLAATRKARSARNRKAVREAIKKAGT